MKELILQLWFGKKDIKTLPDDELVHLWDYHLPGDVRSLIYDEIKLRRKNRLEKLRIKAKS